MKRVFFVEIQQYDQMMNVYGPQINDQREHLAELKPHPNFTSDIGH